MYENWARLFFSELKTLIHELIWVKNDFHPAPIKNNNAAIIISNKYVQHEWIQQHHKLK